MMSVSTILSKKLATLASSSSFFLLISKLSSVHGLLKAPGEVLMAQCKIDLLWRESSSLILKVKAIFPP